MTDIYEYNGDLNETKRLLRKGIIVRIFRGGYVYAPVTAEKVLALIKSQKPTWILCGRTVLQLELGKTPTFPIQAFASRNQRNIHNSYLDVNRSHIVWRRKTKHGLCVPILHAITQVDRDTAVAFLRQKFSGKTDALEKEMDVLKPFPRQGCEIVQSAGLLADSVPERKLIEALSDKGYKIESNETLWGYRWDIVLRPYKLLIEVDGYAYHNGESRNVFIRDRWKQNTAVLEGWKVLRFSAVCVENEIEEVLKAIELAAGKLTENTFALTPVWNWHHHFASWPEYYRADFT